MSLTYQHLVGKGRCSAGPSLPVWGCGGAESRCLWDVPWGAVLHTGTQTAGGTLHGRELQPLGCLLTQITTILLLWPFSRQRSLTVALLSNREILSLFYTQRKQFLLILLWSQSWSFTKGKNSSGLLLWCWPALDMAVGWKRERRGPFSALCRLQPLPWQGSYRHVALTPKMIWKEGTPEAFSMPPVVSLAYLVCVRGGATWWQPNSGIKPALWPASHLGFEHPHTLEAEGVGGPAPGVLGAPWGARRQPHLLFATSGSAMQKLLKYGGNTKDISELNLLPQHVHQWVHLSG